MKTCENCGERVYALGCVSCNESAYMLAAEMREEERQSEREHDWEFYFNGTFCRRCNARIGDGSKCQ